MRRMSLTEQSHSCEQLNFCKSPMFFREAKGSRIRNLKFEISRSCKNGGQFRPALASQPRILSADNHCRCETRCWREFVQSPIAYGIGIFWQREQTGGFSGQKRDFHAVDRVANPFAG